LSGGTSMARSSAASEAVYPISINVRTGVSLRRYLVWFRIVFLAVIFVTGTSSAQVSDPVVTALAPTQGAGHHYIGLGAETVNPADGSVSFDLPIPTPPGRQLSFPFGIHYGSTEPFSVGNLAGTLLWQGSLTPPFNLYGWSYELPSVTGTVVAAYGYPDPSGQGTDYCDADINLSFRGFEGVESAGYVANEWPYTPPPANISNALPCYKNQPAPIVLPGDNGALLTIAAPLNQNAQQPMNIADRSGTVYQFPLNYLPNTSGNPSAWGLLAQTITDKNGNTITLNGTNNNSSFQSGNYVDTLGRNVVSWTGIGSSTGDQLAVAGLGGNFVVKWQTITITFPVASQVISAPYGGCTFGGYPNSAQIQTVSEIDLPNGTKYTFTYGGQYGGLIRVTFPEGGYARYTWADNPLSQATFQTFNLPSYSFNIQCYASYDTPAISDRYVSYDGTTEVLHQHFAYATAWPGNSNPNWTTKSTTVTNTDLRTGLVSSSVYNYGAVVEPNTTVGVQSQIVDQVPVEQSVVYKDGPNGTGNTLKTVNKTWLNRFAMIGEQTILDNGQGSTILRCYDSTNLNRVLAEYQYGFQSEGAKPADPACALLPYGSPSGSTLSYGLNTSAMGPLRRQTATVYHNFGTGDNLLDAPDSVTTSDGSGNKVKQTTYTYTDTVQSSGTGVGLVAPPQAHRGNVATAAKWITGSTWATTSYAYFDNGQLQSVTDPCGNGTCSDMTVGTNHTTTYSYADEYSSGTPPETTNAYLTTLTRPTVNGMTTHAYYQYAYTSGQLTVSQDDNDLANGTSTSYVYADPFLRPTQINYPDLGQTEYKYNDAPPSPSVTTCQLVSGAGGATCSPTNPPPGWKTALATMDGMGHVVQTELVSDPDGPTYTGTSYDGTGRTYQTYNPTRCNPPTSNCGEATWGVTTYTYDALGRTKSVAEPDGSAVGTSYNGNCTTVTDEAGNQRESCTDGLGRMTGVWEAPNLTSTYNFETDYSYDALNNLLGVTQKGGSSSSSNWRPRSFAYDGLSRLTSAINPESGTITYSYDLNSNLTTRVVPKANQTGTLQTTHNYTYDVLNRLVKESHLDPNQGTELYSYDGITLTGCSGPTPPRINSPINLIGRRSAMCAGLSSATLSYDAMGRSLFEATANKGSSAKTYIVGYTYYLDGSVNTLTYPSGDVVTYAVGGAGRTTQLSDSYGNNYVGYSTNSATYSPAGALATMTNGHTSTNAGIVTANTYNDRLQPFMLSAGVGQSAIFSICYDFHLHVAISNSICNFPAYTTGNNGSVFQVLNNVDSTRSAAYIYDPLNRIAQAYTQNTTSPNCWGETYSPTATAPGVIPSTPGIDPWGNLVNRSGVSGMGSCATEGLSASATTNNQLGGIGMNYDAAGNVTKDNLGNTYTYDGENRIATAAGYTYSYDADGTRMEKAAGSTGTMYWMGQSGALTETDLTGAINEEYIFFNGERIARVDQPTKTVHYYFSDHLGSISIITDALGNLVKRDFYLPYGAELSTSTGSDPNHYKFNGKERDTESGLDMFGARYYGSSLGRFATPDWAAKPVTVPYAHFGNPQSLNLYSYVENNPTTFGDPDGHGVDCDDNCNTPDSVPHGACFGGSWCHIAGNPEAKQRQNDSAGDTIKSAAQKATKAEADFINAYIREIDSIITWGLVSGPSGDNGAQRAGAKFGFFAMLLFPEGDEAEAARLLSRWSKGSFETLEKSILYHFAEHGEEVGAQDLRTYLRKAAGFSTKGAERVFREDGTTLFRKGGRYIIKDAEGLIRSFGVVRGPI
jgi:RHS repeat-associated protein